MANHDGQVKNAPAEPKFIKLQGNGRTSTEQALGILEKFAVHRVAKLGLEAIDQGFFVFIEPCMIYESPVTFVKAKRLLLGDRYGGVNACSTLAHTTQRLSPCPNDPQPKPSGCSPSPP